MITPLHEIEKAISDNKLEMAIEMLDHNIEHEPDCAQWWYLRGKVYWRMDRRGNAISDYEEAVHLDPESPAAHALEYTRGIMDFFNPDMMNP